MKYVILDLNQKGITETAKAFSVPCYNGKTSQILSNLWFPKSKCKISHDGFVDSDRVNIFIPYWIIAQKTSAPQFIEGFNEIKELKELNK